MIFFFCQNADKTSVALVTHQFCRPQKLTTSLPPFPPSASDNKNKTKQNNTKKTIRDYVKAPPRPL